MVAIVWGSKAGLSGGRELRNDNHRENDRYGEAVAAGDFTGDGLLEVATGSTGMFELNFVSGPFRKTGSFGGGNGGSLSGGSRPFSASYGIEYLSSGDVMRRGTRS